MRTDTAVRDVMHREFPGVSESDSLRDATELMLEEGADCLVVIRGREPVGCLTPRDALSAVLEGTELDSATVADVMSPPVPSVPVDTQLTEAEERLVSEGTSRLLVTVEGEAVGVLTEQDVLTATRGRLDREEPDVTEDAASQVTQSICEACGSLSANLSRMNGQLLCPDCADV